MVGTDPEFKASAYVCASVPSILPERARPLTAFARTEAKTLPLSFASPAWNSGRSSWSSRFERSRKTASSSAGRTSVTQSRSRKNELSSVLIWFRDAASDEKDVCGLSAFSRYCRSLILRPPSSSLNVKSRTTHMNEGKCSASESSSCPPAAYAGPPAPATKAFFAGAPPSFFAASPVVRALFAASLRTWMCFVRLTTSAKSSKALPSMTPREFQTKSEERRSAREKICESSVWVREVEPSPSVSTKRTDNPSSSLTGWPQSHKPFVQALTVAPTAKPFFSATAPLN
mmetsp:Transcript_22977/g.77633  ORF Transcript_22977/g.77633 Transcript_22977/m.77633 type:complete len:287 (-) Transcript_22977:235-1095(-)